MTLDENPSGETTPAENPVPEGTVPSHEDAKEAWRQKEAWQKKYEALETTVRNVVNQPEAKPPVQAPTEEKEWRDRWLEFIVDNPSFPREHKDSLIAYAKGKSASLQDAQKDQFFQIALQAHQEKVRKEGQISPPSTRSPQFENMPIKELMKTKDGREKVKQNWDTIRETFKGSKNPSYI